MPSFGFASFRNLIKTVAKEDLFDAVKPELQDYADFQFSHRKRNDAYTEIFALAHSTAGEKSTPPSGNIEGNIVERMGKGRDGKGKKYKADRVHAEWIYFFFLFSDQCKDPVYAERIDDVLFGESFHDAFMDVLRRHQVARPTHLSPLKTVSLGPIGISLGHDVGLKRLSLQELADPELEIEGEIGVFRALGWRSRLTSLHGRSDEYDRLLTWALDTSSKKVKVLLVSGPGGVGKTRLIADAVSHLVRRHRWKGGFLPKVINDGDVFDGGGEGCALIIDYPEERTEVVKKVLYAATYECVSDQPVRIILASRENIEAWRDTLNLPYLEGIEEIRLGASAYLNTDDAREIVEDVLDEYPDKIGKAKVQHTGLVKWLNGHYSHRLPLICIAAAVHAVLKPERAFSLSGKDVLITLARIERRRVRSFSKRDLGDYNALERLLGLSLLTPNGLSQETILALGRAEICDASPNALLDGLRNTPFWQRNDEAQTSFLLRIEPDLPAAAFLHLALNMDEPLPGLSSWMAAAAAQDSDGFGERLGKLAVDLAYLSPSSSRQIEFHCVQMIESNPELAMIFQPIIDRQLSDFSTEFGIEICRQILSLPLKNGHIPHRVMNNLATFLIKSKRHSEALEMLKRVIFQVKGLEASGLGNLQEDLAGSYDNMSAALSALGRGPEALRAIDNSLEIWRKLVEKEQDSNIAGLARALNNKADILRKLSDLDQALDVAREARSFRQRLAEDNPAQYNGDLATSLNNEAMALMELEQYPEALRPMEEAVRLRETLAAVNPEIYLPKLATSLINYASVLNGVKRTTDAIAEAERATALLQTLADSRPNMFQSALATAFYNTALIYAEVDMISEAVAQSGNAISVMTPAFLGDPDVHFAFMQRAVGQYWGLCEDHSVEPNESTLNPIAEAFAEMHRKMLYNGSGID